MCGIIGILGKSEVASALYDALTVLQHRGQDAAGIATVDGSRLRLHKGRGLVQDVFNRDNMLGLRGVVGIGIQDKAKQTGFEWKKAEDVFEKVEEEMDELKEAIAQQNQPAIEEEFGDVLFSLINYARFLQVDPENALEKINRKFIHRFQSMEKMAAEKNTSLHALSLKEMDAMWNTIKNMSR